MRAAATIAAALVLTSLVRAQDSDWKWDPQKKHKATVGYRSFIESEDTNKQKVTATVNGKVVQKQEEDAKTTYRFTREIVAMDGDDVTESKYQVEKWSRAAAESEPDNCLEGATVVVKRKGDEKSWKATNAKGKEVELTEEAQKWVEENLAKKEKSKDDEPPIFPEKPIGPNTEWTRDPAFVAKKLAGEDAEIDAEKSSCKGKLGDVKVVDGAHEGHIDVKVHLVIKKSKQWSEGLTVDISAVGDASLEEDKRDAAKMEVTLVMNGKNVVAAQGGQVVVKLKMDRSEKKTEGPLEEKK